MTTHVDRKKLLRKPLPVEESQIPPITSPFTSLLSRNVKAILLWSSRTNRTFHSTCGHRSCTPQLGSENEILQSKFEAVVILEHEKKKEKM